MLHVTFTGHDESILLWQIGRADAEISDIQREVLTARCKEHLLTEQGRVRNNLRALAAVGGGAAIDEVRQMFDSAKGKAGANAKHQKYYRPIIDEAYRLALEYVAGRDKPPSRRSVAIAIRQKVKAFAAASGVPLTGSDESILNTIYLEWLPDMEGADTLFAGKRTTPTG